MIALIFFLVIGILLEASVTMLPLTLSVLISFIFFYRNSYFILISFIAGLILDALTLKTVGFSSIFFLVVFLVLNLYERKLESTLFILFFVSFIASFIYLFAAYYKFLLFDSLITAIISVLIFQIIFIVAKRFSHKSLELRFNG